MYTIVSHIGFYGDEAPVWQVSRADTYSEACSVAKEHLLVSLYSAVYISHKGSLVETQRTGYVYRY